MYGIHICKYYGQWTDGLSAPFRVCLRAESSPAPVCVLRAAHTEPPSQSGCFVPRRDHSDQHHQYQSFQPGCLGLLGSSSLIGLSLCSLFLPSSLFGRKFSLWSQVQRTFFNKISHSFYTHKQYQHLLENYLAYFEYTNIKEKENRNSRGSSLNCVLTNIQTQTALGSPMLQHIWSPTCEKVPGSTW